jgi:hypothetical protein
MRKCVVLGALTLVLLTSGLAGAEAFQAGGAALVANQNLGGGWGWPNLLINDAPNILAPAGMGLVTAFQQTNDSGFKSALVKAGTYLLKKDPWLITAEDGYLAVALDKIFGVTTYTDFVKNKFYTPLAQGKFDIYGNGTFFASTYDYVVLTMNMRDRQGYANLAALDLGMGLYAAGLMKVDTTPWVVGVKLVVNTSLKAGQLYDVLGLSAAVLGLASVKATFDPTSGDYAAATKLADLAATVASYQLATGGFTWNVAMMTEGKNNESVQETAIAIMALSQMDAVLYAPNLTKAANYLKSVQLTTGGWENYVGAKQNNEVTGEALWGLGTAVTATQPKTN